MDNPKIHIALIGKENFKLAIKLSFQDNKMHGYKIDKDRNMILFNYPVKDINLLPYPMDAEQASEFIWGWLETEKEKGIILDHDGINVKGFEIKVDNWGQIKGETYSFLSVSTYWAMLGK